MINKLDTASELDDRLIELMVRYEEAWRDGDPAEREAILAAHPDLAPRLTEFFGTHDHLRQAMFQMHGGRFDAPSNINVPGQAINAKGPTAIPTGLGTETTTEAGVAPPTRPAEVRGYLGNYEILGSLGVGGMGVVFRARHFGMNRLVALKLTRSGRFATDSELRRFHNEVEAVASLDHPGIVPIYEIGEHRGRRYFAMKLFNGGSLADRLDHFLADPRGAACLIAAVARAVHHAHQRGILHRDLKPSNILLDESGAPHVADFGLAKRLDAKGELTESRSFLGSPLYVSPEQARCAKTGSTTASDVYSLGAVLYALVTGRAPFEADSAFEAIQKVCEREPDRPSRLNPAVDRDLETICLKCLEKEPSRRYASAEALAEDLDRWLADIPIAARPAGTLERIWRWARRNPMWAAMYAVLVLDLAVVLVSLFALWRQSEKRLEAETKVVRQEKQSRQKVRHSLYDAHTSLLQVALRDKNPGRAQQLLDLQVPDGDDPDFRGFEWHYYRRLLESGKITLSGHAEVVTAVAFARDGQHLASGSRDGVLRVWELATGLALHTLPAHPGGVAGLAFSPDGRLLASVGNDQRVRVWETATGRERFSLSGQTASPGAVSFSPDGMFLAIAGDARVAIRDVNTGKEVASFSNHTGPATAVAFCSDGRRLASAAKDKTLRIWEADTGKELSQIRIDGSPVVRLAFADDRGWTYALSNGSLGVADPEAGKSTLVWQGGGQGRSPAAWSPDGRQIVILGPAELARLLEASSGRELLALRGHTATIASIAFSADGSHIATAGEDRTVKIWATSFDLEAASLPREALGEVFGLAFHPNGRHLASVSADGMLRVREAATGQDLYLLRAHLAPRRFVNAPDQTHSLAGATAVAYSRDGQRLATGGSEGLIRTWDAASGKPIQSFRGHSHAITSLAYSPDGLELASSSWDRTVRTWDAATGTPRRVLSGHTRQASRVAYSPDGKRLASSSWDQTIRLWDPSTGQQVGILTGFVGPRIAPIDSLSFSPDGLRLAAASNPYAGGGVIKVFDLETQQELHSLRGHIYGIYQVVFSPDGRRLATASCEGALKLWDVATGQELLTFRNQSETLPGINANVSARIDALHSLAFSPDGLRLALGCRSGRVRMLDAAPTKPELLLQREAYRLVHSLFNQLVIESAIVDHLRGRDDLTRPLRDEALARAKRYRQAPEYLNDASWRVVSRPGAPESDYLRALRQIEEACRLAPSDGELFNTLGAAQYRAGRYSEAVETLRRSDQLNSARYHASIPADLAFLAMAYHRLDQHTEARECLTRLRESMKQPPWRRDADATALHCEVESLIQ